MAAGHNAAIVAPRTNQSGKGTGVADAGAVLNLQFHPAENQGYRPGGAGGLETTAGPGDFRGGTVSASVWALNSGYPAMAVSAGLNPAEMPTFPSTLLV